MAVCDVCGNDYDKSFEVRKGAMIYTFDSFECAIHKLAPQCTHCECRIVGHGVEAEGRIYCCANCARQHGIHGVADRAEAHQRGADPAPAPAVLKAGGHSPG
jgi:hypothetical protein